MHAHATHVHSARFPLEIWAEQGYYVLMPNYRGSTGYGKAFRRADRHDWGGGVREIPHVATIPAQRCASPPDMLYSCSSHIGMHTYVVYVAQQQSLHLPTAVVGARAAILTASLARSLALPQDYNDIFSGIKHMVASGLADATKLAHVGWSYGGYMSALALGKSKASHGVELQVGIS
jgi:dienelactone hydrolase